MCALTELSPHPERLRLTCEFAAFLRNLSEIIAKLIFSKRIDIDICCFRKKNQTRERILSLLSKKKFINDKLIFLKTCCLNRGGK